ncbi:GIY-YIG nuclease family protein [[Clostridium] spiroforme]|nr:GIY-YIG nuclease family protein [Thomasclavelia spiroformis]MBM6879110.1 GIY-YIG nuclease family protein [Thomasclavelia spiroformis]
MTNPSFKENIKIGYVNNVERRLKELNRSEYVPLLFVCMQLMKSIQDYLIKRYMK